MKLKKKGTTVFLAPHQRRALARLQARRGDSMGHLIREGINLLLARDQRRRK